MRLTASVGTTPVCNSGSARPLPSFTLSTTPASASRKARFETVSCVISSAASGDTPSRSNVPRVRPKRDTSIFTTSAPSSGSLRIQRCQRRRPSGVPMCRRHSTASSSTASSANSPSFCIASLIPRTICVASGSVVPAPSKSGRKRGMTKPNRIAIEASAGRQHQHRIDQRRFHLLARGVASARAIRRDGASVVSSEPPASPARTMPM